MTGTVRVGILRLTLFQFAVFISGSPPLKFEGGDRVVAQLADEAGTVITIPTFHIFGCDDAFLGGAVALYNVCEPSNSTMFDHGLGHIVPRDAENVRILSDILQEIIPGIDDKSQQNDTGSAEQKPVADSAPATDEATNCKPVLHRDVSVLE